ncbi:MAG: UDP-glucose 4-epimerase GalE [Simkaniaceae bacterium]|nr:UDP-glucose 4-epimerase GalE [Simkaniaceae bacterium]
MKAVLVTGGAGYIGSHVCKALAKKGYLPVTIDNLSTGNRQAVKWGPFFEGDIGDKKLIQSLLERHPICGTIHLAAYSNVRESHQIPLKYFRNNVSATLKLLEVLHEKKITLVVFSSTCAIYGMPQKVPIDEGHLKKPINPYGESKLMVEKILQTVPSLQYAILRYFNAAGADLDGEIGESHDPETHLIPLLIQTALGQRDTFTLNGEDHETEDGTPVRDFIHVADLAQAHILALEKLLEKKVNLILNLGTGKGYSVRHVISYVEEKVQAKIPILKGSRFPGDPPILIANGTKAVETLHWKPSFDLVKMIETAWNWHQKKSGTAIQKLQTSTQSFHSG